MPRTGSISPRLLAAIVLATALPSPAFAWDAYGHMAVAGIAYAKLDGATKKRVAALVKLNPRYAAWVASLPRGASEAERARLTFMLAATWPDEIRSTHHDDGDDASKAPDAAANIGFGDPNQRRYWHFRDSFFSTDGTALPSTPAVNAQERIALFRRVLESMSAADGLKSFDLAWLAHLVGDVHQPLHCAARVSAGHPSGDRGGNRVKLTCCGGDLHTFWDHVIGESSSPVTVTAALGSWPAADAAFAADGDEAHWVADGVAAAKQEVYPALVAGTAGAFALTPASRNAARALARKRIALAGARLANLLKQSLK